MIRNLEAHYDACCVLMMAFHDSKRSRHEVEVWGKRKKRAKKGKD
jgi:hypothetical protein